MLPGRFAKPQVHLEHGRIRSLLWQEDRRVAAPRINAAACTHTPSAVHGVSR